MRAMLALEDGAMFCGKAFGATGESWGEVGFNTGMTGYQEVLTDPSYCGQIVVMTYPLIGNCGITKEDFKSQKSYVRGFVVREECTQPSNRRLSDTIAGFLEKENVIGLSGVDTRALTRHLRSHGSMRGVISTDVADVRALVEQAQNCPHLTGQDLVSAVAVEKIHICPGSGRRVVLVDLGSKLNIIRCLRERGCEVVVVPPYATATDIMALNPEGVVLSNGPGDPNKVPCAIQAARELVGKKPLLGIGLGHQILGLALGCRTYKMKFGHRGTNHPVKDLLTGRVYISAHNHGFSIDEQSLKGLDLIVSHRSLNDGTVEGLKHRNFPVFSVQYHPEASPGPGDSEYIFDQFMDLMAGGER